MFCKHVQKASIHISRRSNFYIFRGSKVIEIRSYPSFLVMSITFDPRKIYTLLDAFRTNSRNVIGRNLSMVIPLLANQDLTPMFLLNIAIMVPRDRLENLATCVKLRVL